MSILRPLAMLAATSVFLHLIWERAHIHLYTGYEALEGALPVYVYASLGDVFYTFLAVGLITLFKRDPLWFRSAKGREYAILALFGFFIALSVEYKAAAFGRWAYADAMPLLFGLGLSPLLQMTVLLPLTVSIVVVAERWLSR